MLSGSGTQVGVWRTPAGWGALAGALLIAAYAIWTLATPYDVGVEQVVSSLILILLDLAVAGGGLWLATRPGTGRRLRQSWVLIAMAYLSYAIGEAIWFEYESVLHISPFPSSADYFYLLYYPLLLVGILSFPFAPTERDETILMWLDIAIVLGSASMVSWFFLVAPLWSAGLAGWELIISIAYPVADLLALSGVVALLQRDVERVQRVVMLFLALGILLMTIPDSLFAYYENFQIPYAMPHLNVLWMVSSLCVLIGLSRQPADGVPAAIPRPRSPREPIQLLRTSIPYVATALGLGLLMLVTTFTSNAPAVYVRGTVQGALVLVALVLLRQYQVLRDNIRLRVSAQRLAVTDGLTGVYNRRYLAEALEREIHRAERYGHAFSVILFDIDDFKTFNDTYGHLAGDDLLRELAQWISHQVRRVDIFARFGGDEFALILPETDESGAAVVERKIKDGLMAQSFHGHRLSISVGRSLYRPGMTSEGLLNEADVALYREKGVPQRSALEPATDGQPP